jgi:hypothetical protein
MSALRRWRRRAVPMLALFATACFAAGPALPPVRWFDPLPAAAADAGAVPRPNVRVVAAPHLGREFAVRVAARELAFDGQHQWIAEPRELVAAVVSPVLPAGSDAAVYVEAFELDVTGPPRAHVRFVVAPSRVVDEWADAADRSPAAFAEAMAKALAQAAQRLRAP